MSEWKQGSDWTDGPVRQTRWSRKVGGLLDYRTTLHCSHCNAQVGLVPDGEPPMLTDPAAGWVDALRVRRWHIHMADGTATDVYVSPAVCSDACETALLIAAGYQQDVARAMAGIEVCESSVVHALGVQNEMMRAQIVAMGGIPPAVERVRS